MKRTKLDRKEFIELLKNNRSPTIENLDLSGVNLSNIDFDELSIINPYFPTFKNCLFKKTNLSKSQFYQFRFDNCDLTEANITNSRFTYLFIVGKNKNDSLKYKKACPETGEFYAWKVVMVDNEKVLCKLLIPEDAKRVSCFAFNKCRTNKAKVIDFYDLDSKKLKANTAYSYYALSKIGKIFVYRKGKMVKSKLDTDIFAECGSGIHFFYKKKDAINFSYVM